MLTTRKKKNVIKEYGGHENDTGSTQIQIALLTRRITELTDHLKQHKKDNHSRRGLLMMVGKRRRLLDYLAKNDSRGYAAILRKLDLKK